MSFDHVGGTTALLNNPVLVYADGLIATAADGPSLEHALALRGSSSSEVDAVLQSDGSGLEGTGDPSFTFYVDTPTDDVGGHIEVSEPAIYVPDGFVADDLYAIEFVLDPYTGVLTISLHFSTDPLDHQSAMGTSSDLLGPASTVLASGSDPADILAEQAGNGSRCTIVLTKSTTQTSSTSTVTFLFGLINYTSNSGGSTTTMTRTITVEGTMRNGRCVVSGDKN